eukprot:CAMPEP_0119471388 /NCGR_PEP_ID=MMETSP1344-20130328/3877_1 /TAXON_ID=236787 /ORGANISM="Florenciella parvula, Strain CCMP2471" /LENGTH=52 /DNA_ID=CAMNT_0007504165 /DNA_START=54 /DNA_END=209 /DNA_ORIENTATION=+
MSWRYGWSGDTRGRCNDPTTGSFQLGVSAQRRSSPLATIPRATCSPPPQTLS